MEKKIAVRWEVKEKNGQKSIQLFDKDDKPMSGKNTHWNDNFSCSHNQLTSLAGAPKTHADMFDKFLAKGYVFADSILSKLINKRKRGDITVFTTARLGSRKNTMCCPAWQHILPRRKR